MCRIRPPSATPGIAPPIQGPQSKTDANRAIAAGNARIAQLGREGTCPSFMKQAHYKVPKVPSVRLLYLQPTLSSLDLIDGTAHPHHTGLRWHSPPDRLTECKQGRAGRLVNGTKTPPPAHFFILGLGLGNFFFSVVLAGVFCRDAAAWVAVWWSSFGLVVSGCLDRNSLS